MAIERVYSCPKCKNLFFLAQWNEKTGKCKGCSGSKHKNKIAWFEGMRFDSMAESYEYIRLRDREHAGEIANLRRQVPYKIFLNGVYICKWLADFVYVDHAVI